MKTLYLLRHAKSSWDDPALSDFERPLNPRGHRTAPFMGELMKKRKLRAEIIVSSPAERAKETAVLVKEAADMPAEIVFDRRIYEASSNRLRKVVADLKNKYASAMLVGHNPGIEGFVYNLTGRVEPMPTAALAIIELEIDSWQDLHDNCGQVVSVIRPKEEMAK